MSKKPLEIFLALAVLVGASCARAPYDYKNDEVYCVFENNMLVLRKDGFSKGFQPLISYDANDGHAQNRNNYCVIGDRVYFLKDGNVFSFKTEKYYECSGAKKPQDMRIESIAAHGQNLYFLCGTESEVYIGIKELDENQEIILFDSEKLIDKIKLPIKSRKELYPTYINLSDDGGKIAFISNGFKGHSEVFAGYIDLKTRKIKYFSSKKAMNGLREKINADFLNDDLIAYSYGDKKTAIYSIKRGKIVRFLPVNSIFPLNVGDLVMAYPTFMGHEAYADLTIAKLDKKTLALEELSRAPADLDGYREKLPALSGNRLYFYTRGDGGLALEFYPPPFFSVFMKVIDRYILYSMELKEDSVGEPVVVREGVSSGSNAAVGLFVVEKKNR